MEETTLSGLKDKLMDSVLVREIVRAYHRSLNEHLRSEGSRRGGLRMELSRISKELDALVATVKVGILSDAPQSEFEHLVGSERAIEQDFAAEAPPPIRLHPNVAEFYRKEVENLTEPLNVEGTRTEASETIRELIDETRVVPDDDEPCIHLKGELVEVLALSTSKRLRSRESGLETTLVAEQLLNLRPSGYEPGGMIGGRRTGWWNQRTLDRSYARRTGWTDGPVTLHDGHAHEHREATP